MILSGSVPASLGKTVYADLLLLLSDKDVLTVVDADGDFLMHALPHRPFLVKPNDDVIMLTHNGRAMRFAATDVRRMGRTATGVRGIRLREGDYVVGAARAREGSCVLAITEKGYGKRTPVEEYRVTGRGGVGVRNYMVTEKTGPVIGIKVVNGEEDLLLVTQTGILIRTHMDAIRLAGRSTQGVIVMRFKGEGDQVIALALADRDEEAQTAEPVEDPDAVEAPEEIIEEITDET